MTGLLIVLLPIALIVVTVTVRVILATRKSRPADYRWHADYDDRGLAIIDDVLRQQNPSFGQPIGRTPETWEQRQREARASQPIAPASSSGGLSSSGESPPPGGGATGSW